MTVADVIVVPDPDACALAAGNRVASALVTAVAERGRADWATTGGSTPSGIYSQLATPPLRDAVPWPDVHIWWGDDRYVPRDHPLSNVKPFDDILLGMGAAEEGTAGGGYAGVAMPAGNVHPFPTGEAIGRARGADWCATTLAGELRDTGLPVAGGWPSFDVMLIGIGADGHLLSVFPGSPAFDSTELAMAIPAPTHIEPHVQRVTLHPGVIEAARSLVVVVSGAVKAEIVGRIFQDVTDPRELPARLAVRGGATWIIDEAAAAELPDR